MRYAPGRASKEAPKPAAFVAGHPACRAFISVDARGDQR